MMSKKSPQLRFEGFTDDWEERKLSDVANHRGGTAIEKYFDKDGVYKVISIGSYGLNSQYVDQNIRAISNEITDGRVVNSGELTMVLNDKTANGTIIGRTLLVEKDNEYVINQRTEIISPKENFDSNFAYTILNGPFREKVKRIVQGGTQIYVNYPAVSNLNLELPKIEEQQKIGSFFKELDDTIALHQRKLDLLKEQKKGYLQKMFPKNGEKVPELRFAGFADDWEERKLSSMTNYKNGKSHEDKQSTSGKLELINLNSISISGGLKHSGKFIDEADDTLQKDDLVMILSDVGHGDLLGRVALIPEDDRFVLNQRVALLRPNTTADPQFLFSYINAHQYYFKAQGAGMSQLNISKGSVENFISFVPIIEEQKKIGSFFKQLDDTIALHQRKLDLLKEQKKGYLQKMFPKNGAKVPELRFAGFADDWEERKLSSGLREYTDRVIVEDDKEYYQISVRNNFGGITLRGSKMGNKIGRKRQAKINLTKYPQTLIFTRQTVEQGGIGWVDKYCDGAIVTENMPTISLDTSVFSKYFLTNLFQTRIFYKNAILDNIEGGSAQIAIHESKFLSSTLLFPNLDEQEKIGQFFKQLDDTIDLHQRKLDLLKEQKKGFLQKMFV